MGTDFFDELGETITRTAKGLGERAEAIYETQKIRNKISSENRVVDKLLADLGNILYKHYLEGEAVPQEQSVLCEQIDQHKEQIHKYKETLAGKKGQKLCPSCQQAVDLEAAFCSHCGAACPTQEPEEEAGDVIAVVPSEDVQEEEVLNKELEEPGEEETVQEETVQEETEQKETEEEIQ